MNKSNVVEKPWERMTAQGRLKLFNKGDRRVPRDWSPIEIATVPLRPGTGIKYLSDKDTLQVRQKDGIKSVPLWEIEGWVPVKDLPKIRRMRVVLLADAQPFIDLGLTRHTKTGRWYKPKAQAQSDS